MSETATPAQAPPAEGENKPKLDPFVESIVKSFDQVLGPEIAEAEPSDFTGVTLAEAVSMANASSKTPKKEDPEPEVKPAATEQPKPEEKPAQVPPADTKPPEAKPKVVKKKFEPPPPEVPAQQPAAKPDAAPPAPQADDDYIKTLSPEQQEEIALAEYAERSGKKGYKEQVLGYFKAVDKFAAENPDASPDSEEFQDFVKSNKPKITELERRKYERQMIADEAAARARAELEPKVEEANLKLKAIEAAPVVERAVKEVEDTLTTAPEGLRPIRQAVVSTIKTDGYAAALKKFPIEAPIVAGTLNATKAWMEIQNGVTKFNEDDPVHAYLATFIVQEGANMMRQPIAERTAADGRTFLPMQDYMRATPEVRAKHYTFTNEMICDLLANQAILQVNEKIAALKEAGFTMEEEKVSATTGKPSTPPVPPAAGSDSSPRAGAKGLPGAGAASEGVSEHAEFLDKLYPGASKIVGAT